MLGLNVPGYRGFGLLSVIYVGRKHIVGAADGAGAGALEGAGDCAGGAAIVGADIDPAPFP